MAKWRIKSRKSGTVAGNTGADRHCQITAEGWGRTHGVARHLSAGLQDWPSRRHFHAKENMSTTPPVQGYEVVIGFETHAQLCTRSKIFSRASTAFGAAPNTQACAVDLALPGTLPVMNPQVVGCAVRLGLGLGARIATVTVFRR